MGLFKGVKKLVKKVASSAIGKIAVGAAATFFGGPIAGVAASTLLGAAASKPKELKPGETPASPIDALPPVTADAALREQQEGQRAAGGAVSTGADLLGETETDEVKRKRASRTLLG